MLQLNLMTQIKVKCYVRKMLMIQIKMNCHVRKMYEFIQSVNGRIGVHMKIDKANAFKISRK